MITLVTGGARSGKSRHAESLVSASPRVLYIATSQIFDEEMAASCLPQVATAIPTAGIIRRWKPVYSSRSRH